MAFDADCFLLRQFVFGQSSSFCEAVADACGGGVYRGGGAGLLF